MNPSLKKILLLLRSHVGRDNAISAPEIGQEIGAPERTVRKVLAESPDFQPLGSPGHGFYWPKTADEIYAVDATHDAQEQAIKRRRRLFRAFWEKQGIAFPSRPLRPSREVKT